MAKTYSPYHIGTPGKAWAAAELKQWRGEQIKKRDYFNDVVSPLLRFTGGEVFQYGAIDYRKYGFANYPLYAVKSSNWSTERPLAVVTGGVHGYETSGVHGALQFIMEHLQKYSEQGLNVLVLPCVSPWGYETINRWTPASVDPNRTFVHKKPGTAEASHAMAAIMSHVQLASELLVHVDLHETPDVDNLVLRPAKAARDGKELPPFDPIPDGFYLVSNDSAPQPEWHAAMIAAVEKVTQIAPASDKGTLIGYPAVQKGVIMIEGSDWGICGGHTGAKYATTTEVYPDSPSASPKICNDAQVACITSGIDYALKH